jgi:hypothetical protein
MNRSEKIGFIAVVGCFIFATAISFYHKSYEGYLGLSVKEWNLIWSITENGFPVFLMILMSLLVSMFKIEFWLFALYFLLRMGYHISCYCGIYVMNKESWSEFWSIELQIFAFIITVCCAITLIHKLRSENT